PFRVEKSHYRRVIISSTLGPPELTSPYLSFFVFFIYLIVLSLTVLSFSFICSDLKAALKCIHSYTRMCMNLQHRKHFRELFHSTGVMVHELCNNSTYQEEYLKYAPCMKEVAAENEVCFSRYSTAMTSISSNAPQIQNESEPNSIFQKKKREAADEGIKSVCCTFREYVDCSTHTMRRACGEDAALFSRNFLDRMSSSMIKLHCSSYGSRQCGLGSGAGLSATRASLVSVAASAVLALLLRFSMS
ncbi:PREDICTED: uncharacterized protein LOC108556823, partial [Nicrophorus vespilloides]|uniref:Uncharacterized protein LOC108556823 n=1 Tax=Nicrophorus vespilloides TaxID=110193 RepID=A0ABM1M1Y7_NICVS